MVPFGAKAREEGEEIEQNSYEQLLRSVKRGGLLQIHEVRKWSQKHAGRDFGRGPKEGGGEQPLYSPIVDVE